MRRLLPARRLQKGLVAAAGALGLLFLIVPVIVLMTRAVGTSVVDTVLDGKEDMPAFGSDLTDQDVADLLAWLDANVFG